MALQGQLFLGFTLSKELKKHLNQSKRWQKEKSLGEAILVETNREEKEYIGLFIPSPAPYPQIKEKEREIKNQLQLYCPKINLERHVLLLFSQIFIS